MGQTKRELLSRPMTRKEFLQLIGVAILSIIGITNFLSSLQSGLITPRSRQRVAKSESSGFGSRKFGV